MEISSLALSSPDSELVLLRSVTETILQDRPLPTLSSDQHDNLRAN
jgi:hypothetical protein